MRIPPTWHQAHEFASGGYTETTTERGYGWKHQQRRAALLAKTGSKTCKHCGRKLTAANADASHSTGLKSNKSAAADHLECRHCNRSAGGRARHGMNRKQT